MIPRHDCRRKRLTMRVFGAFRLISVYQCSCFLNQEARNAGRKKRATDETDHNGFSRKEKKGCVAVTALPVASLISEQRQLQIEQEKFSRQVAKPPRRENGTPIKLRKRRFTERKVLFFGHSNFTLLGEGRERTQRVTGDGATEVSSR